MRMQKNRTNTHLLVVVCVWCYCCFAHFQDSAPVVIINIDVTFENNNHIIIFDIIFNIKLFLNVLKYAFVMTCHRK